MEFFKLMQKCLVVMTSGFGGALIGLTDHFSTPWDLDDEFHNVFSYSRVKRFDLGRFRKDENSPVLTFEKPGLVKIYCEIHKHMQLHHHVATGGHRGDQRLDLQLLPRQTGTGLGAGLAAVLVDRRPQLGVAHRVELDVGVPHPGLLVRPAPHLGHRPLLVQLVGIGTSGVGGVQLASQVTAVAFEQVDPHPLGIGQQLVALGDELGGNRLVEVADRPRDRIHVPGRHAARGERRFEARQRGAHPLAFLTGTRILAGLAALTGEQILGCLGPALRRELALAACRAHIQRVTPGFQRRHVAGVLGDLVAVHHIWIGSP